MSETAGRWEHGYIEITLPSGGSYDHAIDPQQEPITSNEEIRRVVENADEVYTNGRGFYMWILYEEGNAKIVHGFDHALLDETTHDHIRMGTAYVVSENVQEFIDNFIESKFLDQVYPEEDE